MQLLPLSASSETGGSEGRSCDIPYHSKLDLE